MTDSRPAPEVTQRRLVVEVEDFEEAVACSRAVLGLPEEFSVESEGRALVTALQAGRATLEIVNPAQRRLIDRLELGHEVSGQIRVAFEVTDAGRATDRLVEAGSELVAPPSEDPVAVPQLETRGAGRAPDRPLRGTRPASERPGPYDRLT